MRKFTKQQVDFICWEIGEWYVQWKNQLVDYDNKQHRLGQAKEALKERICGLDEYKDLEDEYDPNFNISKKLWETEPDFLEFVDESTGYRCFIQRHPELKHLCGYVELPKEHKLYSIDYYEYDKGINTIDVHGGVTYTGKKNFSYFLNKNCLLEVCFTVDFVVGFDCGHAGDLAPGIKSFHEEVYRDIEYVTNECKNLAKQLKELEN